MSVTTTHVTKHRMLPAGGSKELGYKFGFILSGTKNLQNDILVVDNTQTVDWADFTTDASGVSDPVTISGTSITMTSATGTAPSGLVVYRGKH